jgi:plasmid stability protein
MAQILIRGLGEDVVDRLKNRATSHGRSLESEVRSILETAASFTAEEARRVVNGWQRRLSGRKVSDTTVLLREDRRR